MTVCWLVPFFAETGRGDVVSLVIYVLCFSVCVSVIVHDVYSRLCDFSCYCSDVGHSCKRGGGFTFFCLKHPSVYFPPYSSAFNGQFITFNEY